MIGFAIVVGFVGFATVMWDRNVLGDINSIPIERETSPLITDTSTPDVYH
jgi:hypothetical protein